MGKEKDAYYTALRGAAIMLNIILLNDKNVSEIVWYDTDDNTYDSTQLR